jgi:hypothetical protein
MKKTRFYLLLFIAIINFGCRKGHELLPLFKSYDAFPLFVKTNNNVKLYYRHGTAHLGKDGVIVTRTSIDGGRNFSEPDTLLSDPGIDVRNISGGVTSTNRIILFALKRNVSTNSGVSQGYIYSDDEGKSWSTYQKLPTSNLPLYSPYGQLITIGDGKIMQAWYGIGFNGDYFNYIIISNDNGLTWSFPIKVVSSDIIQYTEASYAYLGNSVIIGLIRNDKGTVFRQVISLNNGQTWSDQGDVNFDSGIMVSPWLSVYTDASGKKYVMAFYANRTTNDLCAVIGTSSGLRTGVTGWIPQSLKRLAKNRLSDFGYPSVISSGNGLAIFGVYYKAYSYRSANLNFFTFTPSY